MKNIYKIASILALLIGAMSVFAGSKVLLGIDTKEYNVLNWLVFYNVILGFISIVASYLIWKKNKLSKSLIPTILVLHSSILIYLYFFSEIVAAESMKAMTFRVSIWIVIFLLTFNYKNQTK
ncbi:hypothetical protein [uncultured Lutibacter sp.]|uniref:hypothetical protein n=1 Tax=uncultured Lutibacter sp. TaxID=437739 RepID=UPI0026343C5F|nr:hypothetical protein [uncultured Lutibacter sp.]